MADIKNQGVSVMEYKNGDKVRKVSGDYHLDGVIVSIFTTLKGNVRVVVEHDPGFLHIYNPTQLALKE